MGDDYRVKMGYGLHYGWAIEGGGVTHTRLLVNPLSQRMALEGNGNTVVLDAMGNMCVAGSTGGVLLKTPGRVGDTPMVGAKLPLHLRLSIAGSAKPRTRNSCTWTRP